MKGKGNTVIVAVILITVSLRATRGNWIEAIRAGTNYSGLDNELDELGLMTGERAVIVVNRSRKQIKLWCASIEDFTGEKRINPNGNLSFKFRPLDFDDPTVFWCTAELDGFWAKWDVFGINARYGFRNRNSDAYEYVLNKDGVNYGRKKIRGLGSGRHEYILWEWYDENKRPFGLKLRGFVDTGMCNNLPVFMERKTSLVVVCKNQCVILYSGLHCKGQTSRLQANRGCNNFWLTIFDKKARSVKGC